MGKQPLVVVYDDKMLEMNKTSNINLKRLYECPGTILTIGDGDFSFSTAIATQFRLKHPDGTSKLIATSYDSLQELNAKYPISSPASISTLSKMGVHILHRVDARKLYESLEIANYRASLRPNYIQPPKYLANCGRIIFNFPHVGGTNVGENQKLLSDFFLSCFPLLIRPSPKNGFQAGEVHISLRNSPFYNSWGIEELAIKYGYKLVDKSRFHPSDYPGYQEQRTNPGVMRALPPASEGATIYRFVVDPKYQRELQKNGLFDVQPVDFSKIKVKSTSAEIYDPSKVEEPKVSTPIGVPQANPSVGGTKSVVVKKVKHVSKQSVKHTHSNDSDDVSHIDTNEESVDDDKGQDQYQDDEEEKDEEDEDEDQDDDDDDDANEDTMITDLEIDQIRYYDTNQIEPLKIIEVIPPNDGSTIPTLHQVTPTTQMLYRPLSRDPSLPKPTLLSLMIPHTRAYRSTMATQRALLVQCGINEKEYSDEEITRGVLIIKPFPVEMSASAVISLSDEEEEGTINGNNDDDDDGESHNTQYHTEGNDSDEEYDERSSDSDDNDDAITDDDDDYDIYTLDDHEQQIKEQRRQQKRQYKHRKRKQQQKQRVYIDPDSVSSFIGYIVGILPPEGTGKSSRKRKAMAHQGEEKTPFSDTKSSTDKNSSVDGNDVLSSYTSFARKKVRPNAHKTGIDKDEFTNLFVISQDGYEYKVSEKERQSLIKYKAETQKRLALEKMKELKHQKNEREKAIRLERERLEKLEKKANGPSAKKKSQPPSKPSQKRPLKRSEIKQEAKDLKKQRR